jgi:ABC-type Mn2+/Zn2+ transport system ATPase subunit
MTDIDSSDILVKDLTFGYTKTEAVLHHIDMRLRAGDRCLLVGPNGSGGNIFRIFD